MLSEESSDDSTNEDGEYVPKQVAGRYESYTYDTLIKLVMKHAPESTPEKIKAIAKWQLNSNENILQSLLNNRQDEFCMDYEKYYSKDKNE